MSIKMERYKIKQFIGLSIIILFTANFSFLFISNGDAVEPYFTLVFKTSGGGDRSDYGNLFKQQLARIGINVDVIIQDWPTFIGELIYTRDFDTCYVAFSGNGGDPDMTGIYNENGSLNLFGYHTSMDYNETLGTGLNEWYMKEGTKILPPDSQERVEHYWAWQQHLMDNLLPCLPTFTPKAYIAHWGNLQGYNFTDGILQSWGKMNWDGSHLGQENASEIVITDAAWSDLNPLFQDDDSSSFISSALMDTLVHYDSDLSVWPHLATNWTHITDTQIRVKLREGIKWQPDYDGNFTNEYFDARDVYFTFKAMYSTTWDPTCGITDMEIIDNYTIDFFIDGDSYEPGAQSSALYLPLFCQQILPEHYLNQTQLADGITPDISHPSWYIFATKAFGTGLFSLTQFEENQETILTVNPECWKLNASITSDPNLDWENRFGDFSGNLDQLRVRIIPDFMEAIAELKAGRVDIEGVTIDRDIRNELIEDSNFEVQSDTQFHFGFFGYNMRPEREYIGNPNPAPNDPSLTIGLAIRKAISYAVNLVEINAVVHSGDYAIAFHPIYSKMGRWCNPNIIKYEYDLALATEYMAIAGFENTLGESTIVGINWFYSLSGLFILLGILIVARKKK